MIRTTVDDVLSGKITAYGEHFLYIVWEGEHVLYVGRSIDPVIRLRAHVGLSWQGQPNYLGQWIARHLPQSASWRMELLTLTDCKRYVQQHQTMNMVRYDDGSQLESAIEAAEAALILQFCPMLNIQGSGCAQLLEPLVSATPLASDVIMSELLGLEHTATENGGV